LRLRGKSIFTPGATDPQLPEGFLFPGGDFTVSSLKSLPRVLTEPLIFQYVQGIPLLLELYKEGEWKRINELYTKPPASTEQLLHPEKFLKERDTPIEVTLPDLPSSISDQWEILESNTGGEFFISLLMKEFLSPDEAKQVSEGWGGDQYRGYEEKEKGRVILIWMTAWDSEKDAEEFFEGYAHLVEKKYHEKKLSESSTFKKIWETEEGSILLERRRENVLLLEGVAGGEMQTIVDALWQGTRFLKESR